MVMMGRTAEALFWIGRYTERAENHARLIDVYYHIRDDDENSEGQTWTRLIDTIGNREAFQQQYSGISEQSALQYTTLDYHNTNSLLSCINHARANLRTIREKLPSELWDILNSLYLWLKDKEVSDITGDSPHLFYRQIRDTLSMFQGASLSVMTRENEWYFVESGRYLERAENILRLLKSLGYAHAQDELISYPLMLSVLKSVSGFEAFRRRYADTITVENIVELLMLNDVFPRSVHYCLSQLEISLRSIEEEDPALSGSLEKLARLVRKVKANLACMDEEDLQSGKLDSTLSSLLESCDMMGGRLSKIFFPPRKEVTA
ncbi:alpha-E domain-containing protein [Paenibacillus sp. GP183]|jgi:uncharacterized alpha-E superfamily protein|uniref:alpha-E domain-containing protein n=1 Tax=Paenibacillus sp. GP183 TaxID=1882751 RepID=UPI000898E827|nr:alpha-E domain-containing protein [Paenibacillus sp. GP183]SEB94616.1 Uncharacterized conserved protein, Alpha-E superfamily [Paenibacillus sp. GP183]